MLLWPGLGRKLSGRRGAILSPGRLQSASREVGGASTAFPCVVTLGMMSRFIGCLRDMAGE